MTLVFVRVSRKVSLEKAREELSTLPMIVADALKEGEGENYCRDLHSLQVEVTYAHVGDFDQNTASLNILVVACTLPVHEKNLQDISHFISKRVQEILKPESSLLKSIQVKVLLAPMAFSGLYNNSAGLEN